ncbi:hypothetical protein [Rhodohalobacter sp. 8-1]|uniref:hypothetical protein n=1 Tax=Rhodohalobacter sp. 8-1 TaxID=3131972 RepID=UPI0030EC4DF0
MNKETIQPILFVLVAGFFLTGCYTQLKFTDKEQTTYNLTDTPAISYYNPFYGYISDPYYIRSQYPMYSYGFGFGLYYENFGLNNFDSIVYTPSDDERRYKIRSSGLYSSGDRVDRRSRGDSRGDAENSRANSRSNNNSRKSNSSADQNESDNSAENVRSRTSTASERNDNDATDEGVEQNERSLNVNKVSVPRRSIIFISNQQRTSEASRAVIQNRLRTVSSTHERKTDMYKVPSGDFDLWMRANYGQNQNHGNSASISRTYNMNQYRGVTNNNGSYSRSSQSNSSKVKSSSSRGSRSSSSTVSRTRSGSTDNSKSRSSSSNNRSSGSENGRNK